MLFLYSSLMLLAASVATLVSAQCQNNVAVYNPKVRTATSNNTWFIVPVPKAAALASAQRAFPFQKLRLLDIVSTPDFFPNGFPKDMHPVLTSIGINADIRMSALQISGALTTAGVSIPFVATDKSNVALSASVSQYIAGPKGPIPEGLIPAVASSLLFGGNPIYLGQFSPQADAYMYDQAGGYSTRVAWAFIPIPALGLGGPGAYPEAVDFSFVNASESRYGARTIKTLINTPILLPDGRCQRNTYYFTNKTALLELRTGTVTFGPAANAFGIFSGELMKASPGGNGIYEDVEGLSACAQSVGNAIESCDAAAASIDSAGLL